MDDIVVRDRFYRILRVQADYLGLIDTDRQIGGDVDNQPVFVLHGPKPDIIRLQDEPLRLMAEAQMEQWERIVTVSPSAQIPAPGRIINRVDRNYQYIVQFLIRLRDDEQKSDAEQVNLRNTAKRPDNPLALKLACMMDDWDAVFRTFPHLPELDGSCPQGLVDAAEYRVEYDQRVQYPYAAANITVAGTASAW